MDTPGYLLGPPPTRSRLAAIAVLLLVLGVLATWPIASAPSRLALAGEFNNDYHLHMYVMFWGAHAMFSTPLQIHHTNMFYPERYTFAYSDMEIAHSLLMAPVIATFYNPYLTYNLFLLASIVIGGTGFYVLGSRLTGSAAAGLLGACLYTFNPTRFVRYLQSQHFGDHWLPWLLVALLSWLSVTRLGGTRWARSTLTVGLLLCLHCLSGSHNAVFGVLLVGGLLTTLAVTDRLWQQRTFWLGLSVITLTAALVLLPLFWPYLVIEEHMMAQRFGDETVMTRTEILAAGAAGPRELLTSGSRLWQWLDREIGWPSSLFPRQLRTHLFPGLVVLVLAMVGMSRIRPLAGPTQVSSGWAIKLLPAWILDSILLTCASLAIAASLLGVDSSASTPNVPWSYALIAAAALTLRWARWPDPPHLVFAGIASLARAFPADPVRAFWVVAFLVFLAAGLGPAAGLYHALTELPGVRLIRVPSRFLLPSVFALTVMATYGAAALQQWLSPIRARALLILAALVFAAEASIAPLPTVSVDPKAPEVATWLAEQEGAFTIVEIPIVPDNLTIFARQAFNSIHHWKNLLVGYSGFRSLENEQLLERLAASFPSASALDEMSALNVRFVLALEDRMNPAALEQLRDSDRLSPVRQVGPFMIYRLD